MVRPAKLVRGWWDKNENVEWSFVSEEGGTSICLMLTENQSYISLVEMVKSAYILDYTATFALTFQYPAWMLEPQGNLTPSVDVKTDADVELFMAVNLANEDLPLYVSIGMYYVQRFLFLRRSNFKRGREPRDLSSITRNLDVQELIECGIIYGTQQVMQELCSHEEMVVIETVHKALTDACVGYEEGSCGGSRTSSEGSGDSSSDECMEIPRGEEVLSLGGNDNNNLAAKRFTSDLSTLTLKTCCGEGI